MAYVPGPAPTLDELVNVAAGQARHCVCQTREAQVRVASVRDAIRAAVLRKDWAAVKLLTAEPRIPIAICTCRPPAQLRAARLLALRPRRPLTRRPPLRAINACRTGWPGGLNWFPPGQPLPPTWVRTRIEGGFPTNPRCFPAAPSLLERLAGGGDLFTAQREARTVGALLAAAAEEADRRRRWREFFTRPLPADALSLREVTGACGKRPGPWACFTRWPGGWLAFDHPNVAAHPDVWKGPTPYGVLLPECFGFTPSVAESLGRWAGRITRAVTEAIITRPVTAPGVLPRAPAPEAPPPAPPAPAPGEPILECYQVNLYGGRYGETRTGPRSSPDIVAVNGAPGWACRQVG